MSNCCKSKKFGFKEALKARITGKMNRVDDSDRWKRMSMCSNCEFLLYPTWNCKKCGCFMQEKIRHKESTCPIGKW